MATPADQRLLELLGKWLGSLDLHLQYSSLDDAGYWKIQPWTPHQRPNRWIIELAKKNALALRAQVEERIKMGDATFSESLELMIFLANLVGSEHIERFIPLAEADAERELPPLPAAAAADPANATATREMPQYLAAKSRGAPPAGTPHAARAERKTTTHAKPRGKAAAKPAAPAPERGPPASAARAQVLADAQRLMQWGRKWYELPELIARMADRPPLPEVRRILKESKLDAEKKAGHD